MLVFDIESDGLLDKLTKIHCLHIYDTENQKYEAYDKQTVPLGVRKLLNAPEICGHNIISFDIPAIKKVFSWFNYAGRVVDTLIWTRLQYPNIFVTDMQLVAQGKFPSKLTGSHSLKSYGLRLGVLKGDFGETTDWAEWSQEMSDYCHQDVVVNVAILEKLEQAGTSQVALDMEMKVAEILARQERFGWKFDKSAGIKLYAELSARRTELREQLIQTFKPWYKPLKEFTPKGNNKRYGYVAGAKMTKVELTEFNPTSRQHIADRLQKLFGWIPKVFTDTGQPKIDEDVLSELVWPEAKLLCEYFVVSKRISQLAEGEQAWLHAITPEGRIHGYVNTLGAVTRRMTHSKPNLAQVPAKGKPYGEECRDLFVVDAGHVLLGCDASGLELRCLAHYMGAYDGGAYIDILLNGDIHTANQHASGVKDRATAKRFIYAFLYGAGDELLGIIVTEGDGRQYTRAGYRKVGQKVRKQFMAGLPALNSLITAVQDRVKTGAGITSIDGQKLHARSPHSALNLLLQSAGAIAMKKALVILDDLLPRRGFLPRVHYEFVGNIHDEFQIEVFNPSDADAIGKLAQQAIRLAGEALKFRCPLDGEYGFGKSWRYTH